MKRVFFLALMALGMASSCNWDASGYGEKASITLTSRVSTDGEDGEISSLKMFLFNADNKKLGDVVTISSSEYKTGRVTVTLMPGDYELWAVANAPDENLTYSLGDALTDVTLKWVKSGDRYMGVYDFMTGSTDISVVQEGTNNGDILLERRVAKLKVYISDIPADIDDIYVEITGTHISENLKNTKQGSNSAVGCDMEYDKTTGSAYAELYVFPTTSSTTLNIYFERDYITRMASFTLADALTANSVTAIRSGYGVLEDFSLDFSSPDWDKEVELTDDFTFTDNAEIVEDNRPVNGTPTGENLMENGDFELWSGDLPDGWVSQYSGECDVVKVSSPVLSGSNAALLQGHTYLSYDIPVEARSAYQLKLMAYCDDPNYKWKCACAWYKTASTMLGSSYNEDIQTGYLYDTDGWLDIFDSGSFRAPVGAKYLRVEFRGYSDYDASTGVYLDNLQVYLVKEED